MYIKDMQGYNKVIIKRLVSCHVNKKPKILCGLVYEFSKIGKRGDGAYMINPIDSSLFLNRYSVPYNGFEKSDLVLSMLYFKKDLFHSFRSLPKL
jgi:hypothetical protein